MRSSGGASVLQYLQNLPYLQQFLHLFHFQSLLGIVAILSLAWILSENKRAFPFRTVIAGLPLQVGLALLLLKVPVVRDALFALNGAVGALTSATRAGTSFVFGYLGGGVPPFAVTSPAGLVNFAFGVLPLVIVISAFAASLWHWRILSLIVRAIFYVLRKLPGIGGAVGLGSGSMVFLGNIEGVSTLAPDRRDVFVPLVMRALLSGTMASGLTGSMSGFLPVT